MSGTLSGPKATSARRIEMRSDKEANGSEKRERRKAEEPRPAVVGTEPLEKLRRQAEKIGLIIHGRGERPTGDPVKRRGR